MPRQTSRWFLVLMAGAVALSLTACRTPTPAPGPEPPKPEVPPQANLVVPPTLASTNELQQVTYTFNLPRKAAGGYIIQESRDGVQWTDLGRSTSAHFSRVTFVDSTPSSGKHYRVVLP